jgi:uncharacterized membrane protein (DUF4010 family)
MSETPLALQQLLVALLVGLLIGLDRERAEERKKRKLFAGVRTFPLIALLGAGLALLGRQAGYWVLAVGFAGVAAIALLSYQRSSRDGNVGATTEVAALLTYVLGALAGVGELLLAGATGVAVAVLLAIKIPLERLSRTMSQEELEGVLELAVISAIVLPLLPDRGYGPWQVWNPFKIWMVVVLVSTVSFAGFVAVRWKGERAGLFWAATLGALVSSTATTVAMAQRSREQPEHGARIAAAAVLASVVMCGRLLVLVAVVRAPLLVRLAPPLGAMALTGLGLAFLLGHGKAGDGGGGPDRNSRNPFSLRSAIAFGALFAGILLLVRASEVYLGAKGTLLAALLSGLVDVDAITLALSRGARPDAFDQAMIGIVVACGSNNLFKAGAAIAAGAGRFRRDVALGLVAMILAGGGVAAALVLLWPSLVS